MQPLPKKSVFSNYVLWVAGKGRLEWILAEGDPEKERAWHEEHDRRLAEFLKEKKEQE